jgi:hypothetical protein
MLLAKLIFMRFDVSTVLIFRIFVLGNVAMYSRHFNTACSAGAMMKGGEG